MNPRLQIAAMCLQGILGDSDAIATARKTAGQMQEKGIKTTQFEVLAMVATEYADALIEQEEATRPKGCKKCNGHGIDTDGGCPYCGAELPKHKGASEEDRESLAMEMGKKAEEMKLEVYKVNYGTQAICRRCLGGKFIGSAETGSVQRCPSCNGTGVER